MSATAISCVIPTLHSFLSPVAVGQTEPQTVETEIRVTVEALHWLPPLPPLPEKPWADEPVTPVGLAVTVG